MRRFLASIRRLTDWSLLAVIWMRIELRPVRPSRSSITWQSKRRPKMVTRPACTWLLSCKHAICCKLIQFCNQWVSHLDVPFQMPVRTCPGIGFLLCSSLLCISSQCEGLPALHNRTKQCIATKVAVESAPQSHKVHLTFHQFWFTPQFLKLVASDINIIQYIDRLDRRACSGKDSVQKYARLQKHFWEPAVFCSRCIPFSKPCPFLSLGKHPLNFAPTCFA